MSDQTRQHDGNTEEREILFVCSGNTCRSPMAAAWLTEEIRTRPLPPLSCGSAGLDASVGEPPAAAARRVLARRGITLPLTGSQPVTAALLRRARLVVTMTGAQAAELAERFPWAAARTRPLMSFAGAAGDVTDPYGGSDAVYERCLAGMLPALEALAKHVGQDPDAGDNHERDH